MIRKAGAKQDSARQSAEAIRNYVDERTKIKQIITLLPYPHVLVLQTKGDVRRSIKLADFVGR